MTVINDGGTTGYLGPVGTEVSIAFPHGMTKQASVQTWGELASQNNEWTTYGRDGLLRVVTDKWLAGQLNSKKRRTTWTWNKQRFEVAHTQLYHEAPTQIEEVKPGSEIDNKLKAVMDAMKKSRQ